MNKKLLLMLSLANVNIAFGNESLGISEENKPLISSIQLSSPAHSLLTEEVKNVRPATEEEQILFDMPQSSMGLFTLVEDIHEPQGHEIINSQQLEEKAKKLSSIFIKNKGRNEYFSQIDDPYINCLQENKFPITYLTGLSIDGGGMRGIIPAMLLQELSRKLNKPIYRYFDYIGGTSIGGILALGLTTPNSEMRDQPLLEPSDLVSLFEERGGDIFPKSTTEDYSWYEVHAKLWGGLKYLANKAKTLLVSEYSPTKLENLLKEKIRENTYFHEVLANTLVTAVDISNSKAQTYLFDSQEAIKLHKKKEAYIPIWEVGRSTSAAPTYFPAYNLKIKTKDKQVLNGQGHNLVDGGLWVNNPTSLVARAVLNWASKKSLYASHKNIVLLSLGTGFSEDGAQIPKNAGMASAAYPVIEALMDISSHSVHQNMKNLLDEDNYTRINPLLTENIKLDETKSDKVMSFKKAAESCFEEVENFIDGPLRKILEADVSKKEDGEL